MIEEVFGLTETGELINNETGRVYCVKGISALDLQDELNKLIKENKELKEERKGFEGCSHNWGILYDEAKNVIKELDEENNELKQRIQRLEAYKESSAKFTKEVEDFFKRHEIDTVNFHILDTVFEMYEFYYDKCNELEKQNKELKQKTESFKMEIAELRESEKDNYNITDGLW